MLVQHIKTLLQTWFSFPENKVFCQVPTVNICHVLQKLHPLKKEIPLSFGIVEIRPHSWEILEINTKDFLKGSRKKFQLQEDAWIMTELPLE